MDVETEIEKKLEITNCEPIEMVEMIDGEISTLVPNWNQSLHCHQENHDHDNNLCHTCSSSHVSLSGLIRHEYNWHKGTHFSFFI